MELARPLYLVTRFAKMCHTEWRASKLYGVNALECPLSLSRVIYRFKILYTFPMPKSSAEFWAIIVLWHSV